MTSIEQTDAGTSSRTEQTLTPQTTASQVPAPQSTALQSAAPQIAVRLFAGAAAAYGADAITLRASTLREAIEALGAGGSSEAARVIDRSSYLLNSVACTDLERSLAEGDRLDVLPPFAGG